METLRPVLVTYSKYHPKSRDLPEPFSEKGFFHRWADDNGEACAIVELKDGTIILPGATQIKFLDVGPTPEPQKS